MIDKKTFKLSVIIPCYNEKNTIEKIIDRIKQLKDLEIEIIIIDDYSTDGTREILKEKIQNRVSKILFNEKIKW